MTTDTEIRQNVEAELKWTADVDETDIAVKVVRGTVTLTGYVHSFPEKYRAEAAAKRVAGVAAIANDIEVRLPSKLSASDPEIAREATAAIRRDVTISEMGLQAIVQQGVVTLSGTVPWHYQRERAGSVVRGLKGVTSVINMITLKPQVKPLEVKHRIEDAFRRSAQLDANRITVDTSGSMVTLRGWVRDWNERSEAERSAWSAPGVERVRNELNVGA